jgi:hypothetical protein
MTQMWSITRSSCSFCVFFCVFFPPSLSLPSMFLARRTSLSLARGSVSYFRSWSSSTSKVCVGTQCWSGTTCSVQGSRIFVNGKLVYDTAHPPAAATTKPPKTSTPAPDLHVTIHGHVETVSTTSGVIRIEGSAEYVSSESGHIHVEQVMGSVNTFTGKISAQTIHGSVASVSGNIVHTSSSGL